MSSNATGQDAPTEQATSAPALAASETATSSQQQPSTAPAAPSSTSSPPQTSQPSPPPPSTSSAAPSPSPPSTSASPPPPAETPTTSSSPSLPPSPSSTQEQSTPPPAQPTTSQEAPAPTPTTPTTPETSNIVTVTPSDAVTSVVILISTTTPSANAPPPTVSPTQSTAPPNGATSSKDRSSGGLNQPAKVAIGVVVPIVGIAILAVVALLWWKKRRARREAEAERRKEVEDYAYNPNADPTIPAVGMAPDSYEMREEGSSGYRGWGTTVGGSTGRKASTTMSGGVTNGYSDVTSPTRGNFSEARSGEVLLDGSPEGEILGAMGPSAANNRGDVRRGPSNASSYSAAGRSEGSDGGMGMAYGGGPYYDSYGQGPASYGDNGYGGPNGDVPPPPVIRDNPARRNTHIENPAHYPQQSAGIAQNF